MKFKFEIEISISNCTARLLRGIDRARLGLLGWLGRFTKTAHCSMKKLKVDDYGFKFNFLMSRKETGGLGYLSDVLDQLEDREQLSAHQKWLCALRRDMKLVRHYLTLAEAYMDRHGDLTLATLSARPHEIGESTYSNWLKPSCRGPEENWGVAAADLFGVGCPDDDVNLPMEERRKRWKACSDPLWRSWCDDRAEKFVERYTQAVLNDRLWFPARLERAMKEQSAPVAEIPKPAQPTKPSGAWRVALVAGLGMAALAWFLRSEPEGSTWIECLPNGGDITVSTPSKNSVLSCPDAGLVSAPLNPSEQGIHIQQGQLPVTFVPDPQGLQNGALWRPSPSFARVLTRRRVVRLALLCPQGMQAQARLEHPDWGARVLTCQTERQATLLRPQDAFVTLELTGDLPAQRCDVVLPVSAADRVTLDPAKPCAGLPKPPGGSFPLRGLREDLDLVYDDTSGLRWMTDPLALGSTQMWQAAIEWNVAELVQRLAQASGTQGWRMARAHEVLGASAALFARSAGDLPEVVALARVDRCPSGFGRVALSLDPNRSHADANAAIPLPCQITGSEVGFWIAKSDKD